MTHKCVGKLTIIGSDNGLSPGRRQANIWTNAGLLVIRHLGTNFSEILIGIQTFSFKKMHLKMSSAKWRPFFCLGLNVLKSQWMDQIMACCLFGALPQYIDDALLNNISWNDLNRNSITISNSDFFVAFIYLSILRMSTTGLSTQKASHRSLWLNKQLKPFDSQLFLPYIEVKFTESFSYHIRDMIVRLWSFPNNQGANSIMIFSNNPITAWHVDSVYI